MKLKEIKGYDKLTTGQQMSFQKILERFINAHGIEARNNLVIKSVKIFEKGFRIDINRYGIPGYQILNPKTRTWY